MTAFYNEIDPYAAQWLRNLIAAGHIAPGDVDERSIEDIDPNELRRYTQCHFFAGIGVWSYALRLAGWPDDRPVWTGSCPCQPFSAAGKGKGFTDERHLWPAFHWLISECRPPVVFGEQVASKDGLEWLNLVQADLEGSGYTSAAADLCAAGIGAPHIRQRLYWVADTDDSGLEGRGQPGRERSAECVAGSGGVASGLADGHHGGEGLVGEGSGRLAVREADDAQLGPRRGGSDGRVADADQKQRGWRADRQGLQPNGSAFGRQQGDGIAQPDRATHGGRPGPVNGHWRVADWLLCRDAKWRPVEPGTFPLAYGATARVGRLRAYGNAIVPQVAQVVIAAYMEGQL